MTEMGFDVADCLERSQTPQATEADLIQPGSPAFQMESQTEIDKSEPSISSPTLSVEFHVGIVTETHQEGCRGSSAQEIEAGTHNMTTSSNSRAAGVTTKPVASMLGQRKLSGWMPRRGEYQESSTSWTQRRCSRCGGRICKLL